MKGMNAKYLLIFLLLINYMWASFSIRNLDIHINIDDNGVAKVEEDIYILIKGELDLGRYTTNLEEKNLYVWSKLIDDTEVRIHADPNNCLIKNLKVRPQPPQNYNALTKTAVGLIKVTYEIDALPNKNDSGVVFVKSIKPRVKEYSFNSDILSLPRTVSGNLILDERTSLYITLPQKAEVVEINPEPYRLDRASNTYLWKNTILVDFTLRYLMEETLYEEISSFFSNMTNAIGAFMLTKDGVVVISSTLIVLAFYIYFKLFMIKRKKQK